MKQKANVPTLLGKSDIAQRWGVAQQVLTYRSKAHEDFPKPILFVHDGKTPLFDIEDVERYEKAHGIKKKRRKKNRKEEAK